MTGLEPITLALTGRCAAIAPHRNNSGVLYLPEKPRVKRDLYPYGVLPCRGEDLNLWPSGYEPDVLPNCTTPERDGFTR
jgi:hypothetical protein